MSGKWEDFVNKHVSPARMERIRDAAEKEVFSMLNNRYPDLGRLTGRFSRDAVHMAVIPVRAAQALSPGEKVIMQDGVAYPMVGPDGVRGLPVGVVDPFLFELVKPGDRFWLLLNPGSITGLRHDWSHPDFPNRAASDTAEAEESERWLREYIGNPEYYGDTFEEVIDNLIAGRGGTVYGREERQPPEEFWYHLERYTGVAVSRLGNEYFDCRC